MFKILLTLGKAQIYLIAFAGLTVFPYMMYEKYLNQPQKLQTIAIVTPIVSALMLTPMFYFRRFYKRLLTQISYDVTTKQIILNGWNKNNVNKVLPSNINPVWTKNMRIKQI